MIERSHTAPPRAVWGVAELVRAVAQRLAEEFRVCTVNGELSGFSRAASGHCYFSLKDAQGEAALVRCAMFRRAAGLLEFAPADGQRVEVRGRVGVYEPRGELQFIVEAMQPAGAGALYEQFLRLKARLQAQGLFDEARKRRLPRYPRAVGVVTSLGAAALRDVLSALARRAPHVPVVVYPCLVQGADAPASLVQAIDAASVRAEVDVLIVCRGGGSLEDLWSFNDERVVRAVVAATMPVVSGGGHETDVTLVDFAADLRAPTPTAAAELVAPVRQDCLDALDLAAQTLQRRVQLLLDTQAQRLDRSALRLSRPGQGLAQHAQRLERLAHRWSGQVPRTVAAQQARLDQRASQLQHAASMRLAALDQRLQRLGERLRALDPHQVLTRGYAWLSDAGGHPVGSVSTLSTGQMLQAVLHDGQADVRVQTVRPALED